MLNVLLHIHFYKIQCFVHFLKHSGKNGIILHIQAIWDDLDLFTRSGIPPLSKALWTRFSRGWSRVIFIIRFLCKLAKTSNSLQTNLDFNLRSLHAYFYSCPGLGQKFMPWSGPNSIKGSGLVRNEPLVLKIIDHYLYV